MTKGEPSLEIPSQSTLVLTHFGRRSGKPFDVTIWFADVGGELWIGSLDVDRNWVRNVAASGRGRIDFGGGAFDVRIDPVDDEAGKARYREAIAKKHPILSRVISLFVRGKTPAVFRVAAA